jgi:L-ascorbate metabolism protein UlaG (beta-lactamase superfamily)
MITLGARAKGLRLERMQGSPRFHDGAFHNTARVAPGLKKGSVAPTLAEFVCGGQRRTPRAPLPSVSPLGSWGRPPETGLRATWLGHSTVLLEIDGRRVLTDPVWGERASPVSFAGPRRFQPVPIAVDDLPALDAIVISHDHYDHLDYSTIVELAGRDTPFVTSLGVGAHLEAWGVAPERIRELDWWEATEVAGLTLTAAPSQHFSGRGVAGRNRTLWSSFAVRGPRHAIFFSGDTGLTPEYAEIRTRLGPFDLILLEVGAFHPSWGDIHLGPENALAAHALLGGGAFLPVHWGTFNLALHAWDEPVETLLASAAPGTRLVLPRLGEPTEPARVTGVDPWWRPIAALDKGATTAEPDEPPTLPPAPEGEAVQWPID